MTIYRDSTSDYVFIHPHPGPLAVSVRRGGVELKKVLNVTPVSGRYTVRLSYNETQYDGPLEFVWTGPNNFVRHSVADVVTPLVPLAVVKTLFDEIKSDNELLEAENAVRMVIESYTGQKFGLEKTVKDGIGVTSTRMQLPAPLISIDPTTPGAWVADAYITGNGRSITLPSTSYLTIKQAPPEELLTASAVGGVIRVPNYYYSLRPDQRYAVYGEWGYTHVPEDVQEAAKILINDYACGESVYRERYLENVRFESTLQFNPMAFAGTGNVRADQLLDKYRRLTIGIL